jgi:hypothetical protein
MAERGPIYEDAISLINEPLEPPPLTALEIAQRRWREAKLIGRERKEGAV